MKSNLFKFALIVLTVGILSACGGQAPASSPTEASVPATQAPANPPADTAIPTTDSASLPTEAPTTAPVAGTSTVSFANDITPILQSRCGNCHGGNQTQEGLNVLSYASLMNGSENGPVIAAGDATNSLLVDLVASQKMPTRGPKLTPDQVQLITDWVNQGALDN